MLKLDNTLLDELGLGSLPEDQKRAMLQHIYETLELRVGTNLANQMSDAQLEEFEKFIDDGGDANQAQALQWLEANLPNYKQVVNEVFEALKLEVKAMAPQLLAANAAAPAAPVAAQPMQSPAAYDAPSYGQQPAPATYGQAPSAPASYAQPQPSAVPAAPAFDPYAQAPASQQPQTAAPDPFAQPQQLVQPPAPQSDPMGYAQPPMPQQSPVQDNGQQQPAQDATQPVQPPAADPSSQQPYQFPQQQPPAGPGSYPPQ